MTTRSTLEIPDLEGLSIRVSGQSLSFAGTITVPDPGAVLGGFLQSLHESILADRLHELEVDVRKLTFVNSSAIRLFVDWVSWIRSTNENQRYKLHFITDRRITWQRTSFAVLKSLAQDSIQVEAE